MKVSRANKTASSTDRIPQEDTMQEKQMVKIQWKSVLDKQNVKPFEHALGKKKFFVKYKILETY